MIFYSTGQELASPLLPTFAEHEHFRGRHLHLTIVRPTEPVYINLMKFTSDDIGKLIVAGYQAGTDVIRLRSADGKKMVLP